LNDINVTETINSSYKNIGANPRLKKNNTPYKWISIVPLVGGMAIGNSMFTKNKPEAILSYKAFGDNDKHLTNYWKDVPYHILDDDNTIIPDKLYDNVDFVSTVCPCAGLSALNNSKNTNSRGSDAKQNDWIYTTAQHVLENIQPKVLWGENAPGLFTSVGVGVVENMKKIGKKYGYSLSLVKTNSISHRTPQNRSRTFYFFWKSKTAPILNNQIYPVLDFVEFINGAKGDDLKEQIANEQKISEEHLLYKYLLETGNMTHQEFVKEHKSGSLAFILFRIKEENNILAWYEKNYPESDDPKFLKHAIYKRSIGKSFWDSTPRMFDNKINAIVGNNLNYTMHPIEDRVFVLREMMYMMGLPYDFYLKKDAKGRIEKNHISQNVPAITAMDWTSEVCKFIDGELELSDETFLKQRNENKNIVLNGKKLF
jgi:site-specific DNA-cytosine methylase